MAAHSGAAYVPTLRARGQRFIVIVADPDRARIVTGHAGEEHAAVIAVGARFAGYGEIAKLSREPVPSVIQPFNTLISIHAVDSLKAWRLI